MDYARKKAKLRRTAEEDRISSLPDELIHQILSFCNTKLAVQTCLLSKRWTHIWKSLPHINIERRSFDKWSTFFSFISCFFFRRNPDSNVYTLKLNSSYNTSLDILNMMVIYAASHNVQHLDICTVFPGTSTGQERGLLLSGFSSHSLKTLKFHCTDSCYFPTSSSWYLPALTTLEVDINLPQTCWDLPSLTTLHLKFCELPKSFSNLSALTTLYLSNVRIYDDRSMCFGELLNLKKLSLDFDLIVPKVLNISCLQLKTLEVYVFRCKTFKLVVSAPNLSSFKHHGHMLDYVFSPTLTRLETVHLSIYPYKNPKKMALILTSMLRELWNAKFMTIADYTIKALSVALTLLEHQPSPFKSLKFLKIKNSTPFKSLNFLEIEKPLIPSTNSEVSSQVRSYLLGGSPSAIIVKKFPHKSVIPATRTLTVPATVKIEDPVKIIGVPPVKNSHNEIHKSVQMLLQPQLPVGLIRTPPSSDLVDKALACQICRLIVNKVDNGLVCDVCQKAYHLNCLQIHNQESVSGPEWHCGKCLSLSNGKPLPPKYGHIAKAPSDKKVESGTRSDAICTMDNNSSNSGNMVLTKDDFALWEGHKVDLESVDLLDLIRAKYPETFKNFVPQSEILYSKGLNMLSTSVNAFSKISTIEVTAVIIAKYRGIFADLKRLGFKVTWLVNRLKWVDELCAIDNKLRELQAMHAAKMAEIQGVFGDSGTNIKEGYLGDGLFSGIIEAGDVGKKKSSKVKEKTAGVNC